MSTTCICAVVTGAMRRYDLALACGRAKQRLCCRSNVRFSRQFFADANINNMIFDQSQLLRPRHAFILLSLHTLIPLPFHIAGFEFARAGTPSSSTSPCREQERHDENHPLRTLHHSFSSSSLTARATRRQKTSSASFESEYDRSVADRVRHGEYSTHMRPTNKANSTLASGMITHASA